MLISRKCRICGKPFRTPFRQEVLCRRCRRTLPKCGSCHMVMAPEYGYLEGFARQVGKYRICGGCDYELRKKRFLHISESQWLFPSGRVRIKGMQAEGKA